MSRLNAGMLEAGFIPGDSGAFKHDGDRKIKLYFGGGGGGPQQTQSTVTNTNVPEYAKPYVETMLGATQKQLFTGNPTEGGGMDITGFKPYQAYGGTYDAQGNQTSYDPSKAVAGFSPMQQQAQAGVAGLQVPGQYDQAMGLTGMGAMGSMGAGQRYAQQATNPYATQAYMNPYIQASLQPQLNEIARQGDIASMQAASQATGSGAFGGTRGALAQNEAQRNALLAQQQAIGQGYNQAFNQAQQAQQFGANLGLQGYGQAMQGANQLGSLAGQQLQAQQGILNAQNTMGQQQQAQQQQIINQAMTDYANQQQYPLMQLGFMSNMLRGLPMQATTTNQYQATPNPILQGIGTVGAGTSLYNAFNTPGKREGGEIKMAKGGIASIPGYKSGVLISLENKLDDIAQVDPTALTKYAKETNSQELKDQIKEKEIELAGISNAPTGGLTTNMAGGGIVAFADNEDQPVRLGMESNVDQPSPFSIYDRYPNLGLGATSQAAARVAPEVAVPPAPKVRNPYAGDPSQMDPLLAQKIAQNMDVRKQILGLPDVGEKQAKLMAMLEKEEANVDSDTERKKWLAAVPAFAALMKPGQVGERLAEGMTIGAAGLESVMDSAKKAKRESVAAQADIEKATRAEKRGDFTDAEKMYTSAEDRLSKEKIAKWEVQAKLQAAAISSASKPTDTERAYALWQKDPKAFAQFMRDKTVSDENSINSIAEKAVEAVKKDLNDSTSPTRGEYMKLKTPEEKAAFEQNLIKKHVRDLSIAKEVVGGNFGQTPPPKEQPPEVERNGVKYYKHPDGKYYTTKP